MDALPVVDLTAFRNDPSGPEGLAVVEELRRAAHEVGFVYLCGHGVDPNLDDAMFGTAREFFDLPEADRRALAIEHPLPPRSDVSGNEELLRLWQDAGLRDIEQQAFPVERRFDSFDSFWDITTSSASLTKIFTDIEADFLQEIRQRLHADMPVADDGSITYTAHANAIKGVV